MESHVCLKFKLLEVLRAEVHTSFSAVARAEIDRLLVSKGVLLRALAGHTAWPK